MLLLCCWQRANQPQLIKLRQRTRLTRDARRWSDVPWPPSCLLRFRDAGRPIATTTTGKGGPRMLLTNTRVVGQSKQSPHPKLFANSQLDLTPQGRKAQLSASQIEICDPAPSHPTCLLRPPNIRCVSVVFGPGSRASQPFPRAQHTTTAT